MGEGGLSGPPHSFDLMIGLSLTSLGLGVGSSGGFSPRSLFTGAAGVFYDMSDLGSLWADTGATTPATVNGAIARVNDKSGNGNNATQGTGASQPTLKLTSGKYRCLFDGVADFLSTGSIDMTASDEITIVAGIAKSSDAATQMAIENTTGAGSARLFVPAGGTGYTHGMLGTLSSDSTATGFAAPSTTVVTSLGKISTDTNIIRVNGIQRASASTDLGAGNMGNYQWFFGMRDGTSLPFAGSIYGLIVINRLLSATEIAQAEAWMNGKTGAY